MRSFHICVVAVAMAATPSLAANCASEPSDYIISDPADFIARVSRIDVPRDQFESDAEYQDKIAKAMNGLRADFGTAFTGDIAIWISRAAMVEYNPRTQILSVPSIANQRYSMGSIRTTSTGGKGYHGAYLTGREADGGYYRSTNGYGAELQVRKVVRQNLGIAWDNKKFKVSNNGSLGVPKVEKIGPITGEDARRQSVGMRALVRGKLAYPFAAYETVPGQPTFNNPVDFTAENSWLFLELKEVCVVAGDGAIINRWDIQAR